MAHIRWPPVIHPQHTPNRGGGTPISGLSSSASSKPADGQSSPSGALSPSSSIGASSKCQTPGGRRGQKGGASRRSSPRTGAWSTAFERLWM
eukprot:374081-Pyramimonas_sp.AAC.1